MAPILLPVLLSMPAHAQPSSGRPGEPAAAPHVATSAIDEQETRRPRARDAGVRRSPFLDFTLGSSYWEHRFVAPIWMGGEAGLYLGGWLRLSLKGGLLIAEPEEVHASYSNPDGDPTLYRFRKPISPVAAYGCSVGVTLSQGPGFVFAPGVVLLRSSNPEYGTLMALQLPFEWVRESGKRIGFAVGVGKALGGTYEACFDEPGTVCSPMVQERPAGGAFFVHAVFGFGASTTDETPR